MFLLSALSGMVAYQLYVDTTQMLRMSLLRRHFQNFSPKNAHLISASFLQTAVCKHFASFILDHS